MRRGRRPGRAWSTRSVAALPPTAAGAAPGAQRDRRDRAHQPGPRAAVGRPRVPRWWPPAATPTWSWTWPPGSAAAAARGALAALARGGPGGRGGARGQQRRRRAGAGGHGAGGRAGRSWSAAASWWRSATDSGCRTCCSRPVPGSARWAPPTGPPSPTTPRAVGPDTGFILKVHPSNFVDRGFTAVGQRRRAGRPGGAGGRSTSAPGCWRPTRCSPTSRTPPPRCAPAPDLVTASGDKLLGGPQAGLLLGEADLVDAAAAPPAGPGAAGRQADPGRAGGDGAWPSAPDLAGPPRRPGVAA